MKIQNHISNNSFKNLYKKSENKKKNYPKLNSQNNCAGLIKADLYQKEKINPNDKNDIEDLINLKSLKSKALDEICELIKSYKKNIHSNIFRKYGVILKLNNIKHTLKHSKSEKEIFSIMSSGYFLCPKKGDFETINFLLNAKNENNKRRFAQYETDIIMCCMKSNNIDIIKELLSAKDEKGGWRFNFDDIYNIIKSFETKENIDVFYKLLNFKDEDGFYRFNAKNIAKILDKTNPQNKTLLDFVLEIKDEDGNYKFNKKIPFILNFSLPNQQRAIKRLLELKEINDNSQLIFCASQNDFKNRLIISNQYPSLDNSPDNNQNKTIKQTIELDEFGKIISKSKTEISEADGKKYCRYFDSNRLMILNQNDKNGDIVSQIELINDKTNEPRYIIFTQPSKILDGAYETGLYDLNDYESDIDVIKEIEGGLLNPKERLSYAGKDGEKFYYNQNYFYNSINSKRTYIEARDENNEIKSYSYQYKIIDENQKTLLDLNRSWRKNPDGSSETIINGKKYQAFFDDSTMDILIKSGDDETKIEFANLVVPFDESQNPKIKSDFADEICYYTKLFNFIKKLSADELLVMAKNVDLIDYADSIEKNLFNVSKKCIMVYFNTQAFLHELGHSIDFCRVQKADKDSKCLISSDLELIEIYKKEVEDFVSLQSEGVQNIISYFLQNGGKDTKQSTGLSELVAQTNAILANCCHDEIGLQTRSEYIVRYFPKTIAKIAQLLGYDGIAQAGSIEY